MMESLAGIRPDADGFQKLLVEPIFTDKLDFVRASYDSVSGKVSVGWEKTGDQFTLKVDTAVPAEIRLPDRTENVDKGTHDFRVSPERLIPAEK